MKRRDFVKITVGGMTALALGGLNLPPMFRGQQALASHIPNHLEIMEVWHEMVDSTLAYSWAFAKPGSGSVPPHPCIPGPIIFVEEYATDTIAITNNLDEPHGFAIRKKPNNPFGTDEPDSFWPNSEAVINPGQTVDIEFMAPPAGTYIYEDHLNSPAHRVLGLHGMLISLPSGFNLADPDAFTGNPYGVGSGTVFNLFNDLGATAHFPGSHWKPSHSSLWIFSEVDPFWNSEAQKGNAIDGTVFRQNFLPRYFTINGMSGYFSAETHDHFMDYSDGFSALNAMGVIGNAGEPRLIRNIHVGWDTHSPHIHANHGYLTWLNGVVQTNLWWIDTWSMLPGDSKDVLYPMARPPDIPNDTWAKLIAGTSEEGFDGNPRHPGVDENGVPIKGFPMAYPMHSHQELSQTSGGGNYPQGMITHIEFLGAEPGV